MDPNARVLIQFRDSEGSDRGPPLDIAQDTNPTQLNKLVNTVLGNDDPLPYSFRVGVETKNPVEITSSIRKTILDVDSITVESTIVITYTPEAYFRVRPVSRCTASMTGHTEAVLVVAFSPDSKQLATGSGDTTVRLWDLAAQLPLRTLVGHSNWVLSLAWSPDGKILASGGMDNVIRLWNPSNGSSTAVLKGHKKWITSFAWEPLNCCEKTDGVCRYFVSASKDGSLRIWDVLTGRCVRSLSGHTSSITSVRWSGSGVVISCSQDRTIKVWNPHEGKLIRSLEGHAHWVNTIALSTDHILRTGATDAGSVSNPSKLVEIAKERLKEASDGTEGKEILASGSDDCTIFLWDFQHSKKPIARLTGHQKPINFVSFSPDGRTLASGSFDTSVKLWDARSGKFLGNLRGHVGAVYLVAWSADSRLLLSASKDSTLKVWNVKALKMSMELPGHADEVYAVDWSQNGEIVASGSKDRLVKLWKH